MTRRAKLLMAIGVLVLALAYVGIPRLVEAQGGGVSVYGRGTSGLPVPIGATGDRLKVESGSSSAATGAAHGEVLCKGATLSDGGLPVPTLVGGLTGRQGLLVTNLGSTDVYLCPDVACTWLNGTPVKASGGTAFRQVSEAIPYYCVTTGADQVAGSGLRYEEIK